MTDSIEEGRRDVTPPTGDFRASYDKDQDYQNRPETGYAKESKPESRSLEDTFNGNSLTETVHNKLTHRFVEGSSHILGGLALAEEAGALDYEALNEVSAQYPEASEIALVTAATIAVYNGLDDFNWQKYASAPFKDFYNKITSDGDEFVDIEETGLVPEDEEIDEEQVEDIAADLSDLEFYNPNEK